MRLAVASSSEAPLVTLSQVGFVYAKSVHAVGSVSFDLAQGEIVSLVGPSGCGKSTLLRLIAGLVSATSGAVERKFRANGSRHGCSMVFQEHTLLPWLTVEDNVGLYYRYNRPAPKNYRTHIAELLDMVGLSPFAKFYPYQLSGGMKRRVAMLTAIAPLPELLLLDEPFSALDEPTRIEIHSDLYMLIRRFNIATVLVTHDLGEAISLSDRILVLGRPPSVVVEEIQVPFPRSRNIYDIRDDARFLSLYGGLWKSLKAQISWKNATPSGELS